MKKDLSKILRCKIIIDEIEKGYYPSLKDLLRVIEKRSSYDSNLSNVSERTIENDKRDIADIFNIYIKYSNAQRGYYIEDTTDTSNIKTALEAINLYYVIQNVPDAINYVRFSPRKAIGIELFLIVLEAIQKRKKVIFNYLQYEKEEITQRKVMPLGLKEYKGFWYLVAKDEKGIKTFGLDRISGFQLTKENFKYPKDFNIDKFYEHCFGIVRYPDTEPELLYIKASPIKSAYYKANKLHASQQVVKETDAYTIFSIFVYKTYDLEQEIRSHGDNEVCFITKEKVEI